MSQFEQVVSLIASARYQLKRKFSAVSQYKQLKEKFHTCSSFAIISSNKKCGILLQDSADTAFDAILCFIARHRGIFEAIYSGQ